MLIIDIPWVSMHLLLYSIVISLMYLERKSHIDDVVKCTVSTECIPGDTPTYRVYRLYILNIHNYVDATE